MRILSSLLLFSFIRFITFNVFNTLSINRSLRDGWLFSLFFYLLHTWGLDRTTFIGRYVLDYIVSDLFYSLVNFGIDNFLYDWVGDNVRGWFDELRPRFMLDGAVCAAGGVLQVNISAEYQCHHSDHHHSPGRQFLSRLLAAQPDEHEARKNDADTGSHGAAHQPQHKLDIRDEDADSEADQDETGGDHVEPGGRDVVGHQLCRPDPLVGFAEDETVQAGTTGEHHQREGESDGDREAELDEGEEGGGREGGEDVPGKLAVAEGDVSKEANCDVNAGAEVDGPPHHLIHLGRSGVRQVGVHLEYVGLT